MWTAPIAIDTDQATRNLAPQRLYIVRMICTNTQSQVNSLESVETLQWSFPADTVVLIASGQIHCGCIGRFTV